MPDCFLDETGIWRCLGCLKTMPCYCVRDARPVKKTTVQPLAIGPYRFVEAWNDGRVWLLGPFDGQVWDRGILANAKPCEGCGVLIKRKAVAWKPLTNGKNKHERICDPCMQKVTIAENARQNANRHGTETRP